MKLPAILAATMLMTPLVVASQAAPLRGPTYEAARYGIATPQVDRELPMLDFTARRSSGWLRGGIIGGIIGGVGMLLLVNAADKHSEVDSGNQVYGLVGGAFAGFVVGSLIGHAVGKD